MPKIPKKSPSAMKASTTIEPSSAPTAAAVSPMISVTTSAEQTVQPGELWRKDVML